MEPLKPCLEFWGSPDRHPEMSLGLSVKDAMRRAQEFRRKIHNEENTHRSPSSLDDYPDLLHAVCRVLEEEIESAPLTVLNDAAAAYRLASQSPEIPFAPEERAALLCSLTFLCWRAARILGQSREAQRWETEYLRTFHTSLEAELLETKLGLNGEVVDSPAFFQEFSAEETFQTLSLLQARQGRSLVEVLHLAARLHESLSASNSRFPRDLTHFFLGSSARLIANVSRARGLHRRATHWLDIADRHFRLGVDPKPQLARTTHARLAIAYAEGRLDSVVTGVAVLDRYLASVGMEEDRIKCSILWAASLKVAGKFDQAIEVLESLSFAGSGVRRVWQGWVLLQLGDIHQICGDYERGFGELEQAARILRASKDYCGLADVNAMIATGLRAQGRIAEAITLFRRSQYDYARLGMLAAEAYTGVLVAEAYLAAGDAVRAEAEIRSVLPTLERHEMVCDVVAGVNLLREALLRKRLEPQSLRKACDLLRPK